MLLYGCRQLAASGELVIFAAYNAERWWRIFCCLPSQFQKQRGGLTVKEKGELNSESQKHKAGFDLDSMAWNNWPLKSSCVKWYL